MSTISQVDPTSFGIDIAMGDDGDLVIDGNGDMDEVMGMENLQEAIGRRLTTVLGAASRYFYDNNGLQSIGTEYGNPAFSIMSEPMTSRVLSDLQSGIYKCLEQENRIVLQDVTATINVMDNAPQIIVTVDYTIPGDDELLQLRLLPRDGSFTVVP